MFKVEPVANKLFSGCAFALRDLVFVVREDEVVAAAVDLKADAELLLGHRRAFDVPAGAPLADVGVPRRLTGLLLRLPKREVARVLFLVLVRVHALARADDVAGEVDLRELAVFGERS